MAFSRAVLPGSRWNCWKMNPTSRPRSRSRRPPETRASGIPSKTMRPLLGSSMRPSRPSSVDLPEPLRPTMLT